MIFNPIFVQQLATALPEHTVLLVGSSNGVLVDGQPMSFVGVASIDAMELFFRLDTSLQSTIITRAVAFVNTNLGLQPAEVITPFDVSEALGEATLSVGGDTESVASIAENVSGSSVVAQELASAEGQPEN